MRLWRWPWSQFPAKVEYKAKPIRSSAECAPQIAHACRLGLPEADADPKPTLRIVANGPSAREAPLDGPTLALNGALGLFTAQGLAPTYWAACDPQPLVADFLADAPDETIYLVASKCHPKVFRALEDKDVRLWHLADQPIENARQVIHGTSITLTVPNLMRRLGWRSFEFWGWDCCVMDGRHHAVEAGELPDQVTATINGVAFKARHAWTLEAQEASYLLQMGDFDWRIMGDGLVAAYMRALLGSAERIDGP